MRAGLWTGFTLLHGENCLNDALNILEAAGFPVCELDERNAEKLFLQDQDNEDEDSRAAAGLLSLLKEHHVNITQIHMPKPVFDMQQQSQNTLRLCKAASVLGCRTLVVHPFHPFLPGVDVSDVNSSLSNSSPCIRGEWSALYKDLFQLNLNLFTMMTEIASSFDIRIAVENQLDCKGIGGRWIGGHPEDLERLIDGVKGLGVTIDTAHAVAQGLDVPDLISWAGERLYGLHIADSDGNVHDYHIMPGKGVLNWEKIIGALKKNHYHGDLHMEIVHERKKKFSESLPAALDAKRTAEYLLELGEAN